uniref:Uncharacterized protein n=1 Tax=Romanomermis culicivorax TaxID=13658 RepID=A0A915IDN7_ROMCU
MPTDSWCTSSRSLGLQLALPALPSSTTISTTALDTRAINQSTSITNMVIPSKEIASAAPIMSPGIICWNATGHAFRDPCHIHSSICQIENLTLVAAQLPIETTIINIINSHCPLLFINTERNNIKLCPNQLIAMAKHMLGQAQSPTDCQVATAAADHDLTDHEPAALDKSLPCHTDQQKLDFALKR